MKTLIRHFLTTMFEGDWSSGRGQWKTVAVGLLAAALPAGLMSEMPTVDRFRPTTLADQLALQVILAAVTALASLFVWQSLFPSRRDYLALAGLPIRARQIFGARLAAIATFAAGLTLALNFLPTLIRAFKYSGLKAQIAASGLECLFVFFAVVALQGVLLNVLPGRLFVRISVYVQGLLFAVCVFAILQSWTIKSWGPAALARLPEYAWAPPVWFAGLHEHLLGDDAQFLSAMANRAVAAVGIAIGTSILTYWLAYRRYRRLLLEAPERVSRPRLLWNPVMLLARNPRQRGLISFMAATMARSRTHRVIWMAYVGAAVAIVLNSSLVSGVFLMHNRRPYFAAVQFLVLFWPIACTTILLPGFKHILRIPAELPANWIFRINEPNSRKEWTTAFERFVLAYTLLPLYAFILPLAIYSLGWEIALPMGALQVLLSLVVFEGQFYGWQQLPFACSYRPGQRPLVNVASTYLVVLVIVAPMTSIIVAAASRYLPLFSVVAIGLLGTWLKIRHARRGSLAETPLLYEDIAAIPDLGIREITSRTPSSDPPWQPMPPHPAPSCGPRR